MSEPETRLAEIRERVEKATPGEWKVYDLNEGDGLPFWQVSNDAFWNPPADEDVPWLAVEILTGDKADAEFIGHAATDIAFLLGRLARVRADTVEACAKAVVMLERGTTWNDYFDGGIHAALHVLHNVAAVRGVSHE